MFLLPTFSSAIQLSLLLFVFRLDTPTYYEIKNDFLSYQESMKRIYHNYILVDDDSEFLDSELDVDAKKDDLPWREVFQEPNLKPLLVGLVLGIIHQTTGISSVIFFSNEIFIKGHTGDAAEFAARIGTFGTGIAGLLAGITAITMMKQFRRKTIFEYGLIIITILLAIMTHGAIYNNQMVIVIATIIFVYVFNATFGSFYWPYLSEILEVKGVSIVATVNIAFSVVFG